MSAIIELPRALRIIVHWRRRSSMIETVSCIPQPLLTGRLRGDNRGAGICGRRDSRSESSFCQDTGAPNYPAFDGTIRIRRCLLSRLCVVLRWMIPQAAFTASYRCQRAQTWRYGSSKESRQTPPSSEGHKKQQVTSFSLTSLRITEKKRA